VLQSATVTPDTALFAILLSLAPISELRGAVPFAMARGSGPLLAFAVCVAANALVGPLVFAFLATVHRLLRRWSAYARLFDRLVERSRKKIRGQVERWGYVGLAVFVAIPLPLTGAYTGALGAWVLGMSPRRSCLAIAAGVLVAGIVVTLVVQLGIGALSLFVKRV
jgi:uncharacterized membrane protein